MRNAYDVLDQRACDRTGQDGIGQRRSERAQPRKPVGKAKDVVMQWMHPSLIVLRQKLRLISCHVYLHRALALAGFATEAEIERFMHVAALEALFAQRAGQHLPEQSCAAARGVLFLARSAVTGTHHAALTLAACAHTHAALGGAPQRSTIGGKDEMRLRFGVRVTRRCGQAVEKILDGVVDAHRIHQLAGIHAVLRVPQRLELAEGLHQLRTKHLGQESGARLSVTVFAAERPAKAEHQVGGSLDELTVFAQPLFATEVKVDAQVHAALSVMTVERAAIAILTQQRDQLAQVGAQPTGRNACVFPAFPAVGLAGDEDGCTQCRFAHMPDAGGVGSIVDADYW